MNGAIAAPWFDWTKEASRLETLCAEAPTGKSNPQIRISVNKKMEVRWSIGTPGYGMRITRREVYHGNTGIALNAVSAGQVNIPVTVRDDTGATIATDTVTLAANGHYAFTLATDRYPAAANIRGTIEFDKPVGAQIGVLGIRIPAGVTHTYTTLPALAK